MFVLIVLFLVEVGAGIAGYILRDKVTFFFLWIWNQELFTPFSFSVIQTELLIHQEYNF